MPPSPDLAARQKEARSLARLAAIVTSSADAVMSATPEGIISDWNPAAERLYGYRAEEIIGQHLSVLIPPGRMPEAADLLARALAGESIEGFETVRRARDGRLLDVSLTVSPILGDNGEIAGSSVIVRDISARKAADIAVAESAKLFRTAFYDAPIAMGLFRLDRTPIQVNRALSRLLGYSEAEMLSTRFRDLTHPEDLEATIRSVDRALSGESDSYTYEKRYIHKEGRVVWALVSGSVVRDDDGTPLYFASQMLDITARKEAEAELAATHLQTRQVLERIADGFVAFDRDWRYTYVNEAAERLLGRGRAELLGQRLWDAFVPLVDSPIFTAFHRAMREGVTETVEMYFEPLNAWIDARAYPSPEGLSVFFRDVTASRQFAQELQSSEEKYRTLVDHLPAVTYLLDADEAQTARYFSPRMFELTGYTAEEVLNRPEGWHWIETIHSDDRARVAEEDARTVAAGQPFGMEYRYQRKDGSYVWVRDESVPVHDAAGRIVAWQGVLLNIDDRVRAEEERARLAAIVESAEDGILSCTLDGIITSWNHGAEKLYGYRIDEVIGQSVEMLRPPETRDDVPVLAARVRQGESISGQETVRLTKDGRLIEVSLSLSPIRDVSGEIAGIASISRDITALRAAEQALRLRDRALAAAPSGIIISAPTPDGIQIVDVNPAFEGITGYTREEALGQNFDFLHGPETDLAVLQRIGAELQAGQDVINATLINYRKDGTPYWVEMQIAIVRDETGAPVNFVAVQTDVTARKEGEAALARERDLLQTLLEHLPDAVYVKDTAFKFVQLNQATARELGLTDPAGAIGKSDFDFFPAPMAEEYQADERRLFATGEPMLSKLERQSGIGAARWVLATKAPLRNARGEIIGLVGINRNVTERIQTEEARARLAAIVEGAEDAITSRALDGTITSWNRGAERLYGYTAEEVIGRSFAMLMPEDERPPSPALVTAFGAPTTQFETRRRRKDGTMVDVSVAMSPIRDDRGETIGVSTITRDITERKRFEQELQEALEAAQAATRTKSLFLAMMSHELRTPLQAVLGYADLLLLGPEASLTPEQREDLSYIHSGASRMVELIEHLLDLSRMEAGRLELAAEPVDLAEIIEQVRQDVAPQAAAKAVAVQIDVPASLPPALGDPDRLRQILLNLAGNAVKFTEQGTVCIRAREAGDGIAVAVIDTGIGISPEALPYIFEEFRQVDGSLTRRYGGAGLGLAIARRLAEQMGGNLTVVSTPGSGSTFTLRMPAAR